VIALMWIQKKKQEYEKKVFERYKDVLTSSNDLVGEGYDGMSNMFYLLNKRYLHWLSNDPSIAIKVNEIKFRRGFYEVLKRLGPNMLKCTQVMENRKTLNNNAIRECDEPVVLPDKPVIFVANHGFYDDALATVLAANRHAYIIWGSLPLLFNTFNGFASSLVGAVCVNRKNKSSRVALIEKAKQVMEYGTDVILFPEGGWNKTSEKLVLDLWKGVYTLSCETQCEVVPIAHYVRDMEILDKKNIIHTVVDAPIALYKMTQDEAITCIRDNLASWQYKMMEKYGQTTRNCELEGYISGKQKWHAHLKERMKSVERYDVSIEKCADYRPKEIVRTEDAFRAIANIREENISALNIKMILDARRIVKSIEENDFQRLF